MNQEYTKFKKFQRITFWEPHAWKICVWQWPNEVVIETQTQRTLEVATTQAIFLMALHHLKLARAEYPDIDTEEWLRGI